MVFNISAIEWIPRKLTFDETIIFFVGTPLGTLGFTLRLLIIQVFSSVEFNHKALLYVKIGSIFVALNLIIMTLRSISTNFMCMSYFCRSLTRNQMILRTYVFNYLPSPLEASALVAQIFASFLYLGQSNRKYITLNSNPNRIMLTTFVVFAILFSYQLFSEPLLFNFEFITKHIHFFSLLTFTIRDFLMLVILIVLNVKVKLHMKKSMERKVRVLGNRIVRQATRVKNRFSIIIWVASACSIVGRIPIFIYVILWVFHPSEVTGLMTTCILTIILSYCFIFF